MTHPTQPPFMTNVIALPLKLPPPFAPGKTAEHPPAHCLCTWTWTPAIGGKREPWALKFWNRGCPVRHF
jgi:hypothetical protein